ncbi:hypothetical protein ACMZ4Y_05070 [Prevotella histicola]
MVRLFCAEWSAWAMGAGRIGYRCFTCQGLIAHDHFTAPPILLPAPCLCTPYRTLYPV